MGAGRKPKPTIIKEAQGNPGRRKLNKDEPKPDGNLKTAPRGLSESQKKIWDKYIGRIPVGLLKLVDEMLFVRWVVATDVYMRARIKVDEGLIIKTEVNHNLIPNPYLSVMNRQADIMLKLESEMGFTPSSRSRLSINVDDKKDDLADFEARGDKLRLVK